MKKKQKKQKPPTKRSVDIVDDLSDIATRAENALGQRWSEDAECMGDEVLALIATVRSLRRRLKTERNRTTRLREMCNRSMAATEEATRLLRKELPSLRARIAELEGPEAQP